MRSRRAVEAELRALVRRLIPRAKVFFPRRLARRFRYSWNGRHLRPTGLTLESQCHDIAHLLVSAKGRRAYPEFGLGPDPYGPSDAPRVVPEEVAAREEEDACAMQLVLARLLGLDAAAVADEVKAPPLTPAVVRTLRRRHPNALPRELWQRILRELLRQSLAGGVPSTRVSPCGPSR
jgi:hypothetical protein